MEREELCNRPLKTAGVSFGAKASSAGEPLDAHACYEALKTHDARYDGRFFVGVSSTHIYCRPICHARLPKFENCTFFRTAAEAEAAGYRPCLQCRPEAAPGYAPADAVTSLAERTARIIEDECATLGSLEELATRLGYASRHVRRAFEREYRVSPQQYMQTCRLLLAKNLLTQTVLPVSSIATACGFKSVRRFNDAFQKHHRLSPTSLRKTAGRSSQGARTTFSVLLGYRPPYAWRRMLEFLQMRAIPGVESVEVPSASGRPDGNDVGSRRDREGSYTRAVSFPLRSGGFARGAIRVTHHARKDALVLEVQDSLAPVLPQVISRVKDLFDLRCDIRAIETGLASMNEVNEALPLPGLRVPGCFDPFEMSVRAVLGQQITVKAASTLAGRMAQAFGAVVESSFDEVERVFPSAEDMLALGAGFGDNLGKLGVIRTRQRTIHALAELFAQAGEKHLRDGDPAASIAELRALPGIGDWTAQYIAMRAFRYADAFPATDLGVKKALAPRTEKQIRALAQNWRPWRAYATLNLWNVEAAQASARKQSETAKTAVHERAARQGAQPSAHRQGEVKRGAGRGRTSGTQRSANRGRKGAAMKKIGDKQQFKRAVRIDSPVGVLTVEATPQGICGLWIEGQKYFGGTKGAMLAGAAFVDAADLPTDGAGASVGRKAGADASPLRAADGSPHAASDTPAACATPAQADAGASPAEDAALQALAKARAWLKRYFAGGKPLPSELPLAPEGSEFRQSVWRILCAIPYGQTTTYGEIAQQLAHEQGKQHMSSQAVGGAVGHNPISIIVPCHRVVGASGSLTGYAGGIGKKRALLEFEGAPVEKFFTPTSGTAL